MNSRRIEVAGTQRGWSGAKFERNESRMRASWYSADVRFHRGKERLRVDFQDGQLVVERGIECRIRRVLEGKYVSVFAPPH